MDYSNYKADINRYEQMEKSLEKIYNDSLKALVAEKEKIDNHGQTLDERINRIDAIKYFVLKLNSTIVNKIEIAKNDAHLLNTENLNFTDEDLKKTLNEIDDHVKNYANNTYELNAFLDTLKYRLKKTSLNIKGDKLKVLLKNAQQNNDAEFCEKIEAALRNNFDESVSADTHYKKNRNEFIQKRDYAKDHNQKFITSLNNFFDIYNNVISREFIESEINTDNNMLLNPRSYPSRSNFISKFDIDLGNGTVVWIGDQGALITEEQIALNNENQVVGFKAKIKSFDFMNGVAREDENGYIKTDKSQVGFKAVRISNEEKTAIPICFIKEKTLNNKIEKPVQKDFKSYEEFYNALKEYDVQFVNKTIENKDWRKYSNEFLRKEGETVGVTLTTSKLDSRVNVNGLIK